VLANDVLPNALNVDIPTNTGQCFDPDGNMFESVPGDSDCDGTGDNVGGPLDPNGGTLVYNRRQTVVPDKGGVWTGGAGPLNDPTAMMYVLEEDLEFANLDDERCYEIAAVNETTTTGGKGKKGKGGGGGDTEGPQRDYKMSLPGCPVKLKVDAPVEPLVLRANAGECIDVNLHNKLVEQAVAEVDPAKGKEWVYSCEKVWNELTLAYECVAGSHSGIFDTDAMNDYLDQGRMLVTASGEIVQYKDDNGLLVKYGDVELDDRMPDLAGWQTLMWAVTRRVQDNGTPDEATDDEMYFFDNNLIRPSAYVGLHPQLVDYDITRHDGTVVGTNSPDTLAAPGGNTSYRWYAGDLTHVKGDRGITVVATPIEFGGSNLLSADRIKQPQKGMFGALVIEPPDADVTEGTMVPDGQGVVGDTRKTRAQVTVNSAPVLANGKVIAGGTYREGLAIAHKIANLRWADGSAIKNVNQEEFGREGAEDSGHAGFNYGMEPSWFRFKLPPNVPSGNALQVPGYGSINNVQAFYANELVRLQPNAIEAIPGVSAAGDPQTPVLRTTPGMATRMHVLNGASADRDSTFVLHGHVWQRDPYVCPADNYLGLPGYCEQKGWFGTKNSVGSQALGVNPVVKYMGGEEGMGHVYGHWPILFDAGGTNSAPGDYLFRDYAPNGNRNGMFGILRVE
jgi:hypothetical protein